MDYHSKLSRGHKPDYFQLGTADFKPFDRSEDDSTVIERIITELTKTDQIKQQYGSQLRRLMKKVSDEFMLHPTMAAAVVANIIDSEARKSPGAGAARLSLGQMLDDMEEDVQHPKQYAAPEGSKRDKQLDQTQKDLKRAKDLRKQGKAKQADELEQRAYRRRERMEKKARKEGMTYESFAKLVEQELREALSKKTKATLKKKAEKRGLTPGSVYAEYKKGLAAWASSGSRRGMSQHQWAMARVNAATPSKSWAIVKKSKAKKK
jgi:hypothetical protein